jgi:hypothetical protein
MDISQAVLLSVIIVLTIFLAVVGFQVFFVLKDLRKTLGKMNKLMEDTDVIVEQVRKPVESAGNLFAAIATGAGIAQLVKRVQHLKDKND